MTRTSRTIAETLSRRYPLRWQAAFALLLAVLPWAAHAQQDLKIGYIDVTRVYNESEPARIARQRLEQEFSSRNREIQESFDRVNQLEKRFEADARSLSTTERARRDKELREATKDVQRRKRQFDDDLNARRNEANLEISDRATKIARQIGDREKFDLIVLDGLFTSKRIDITNQVIQALAK